MRSGVVTWIVSPSETLVTLPETVRMAVWQAGTFRNVASIAISRSKINLLKDNRFWSIVLGDPSFVILFNEVREKRGECQNNNMAVYLLYLSNPYYVPKKQMFYPHNQVLNGRSV